MYLKPLFFSLLPALVASIGVQDGLIARAVGLDACGFVQDAISICSSISPGYLSFAPSKQASCVCYSSTSWIPEVFDGAVQTCADYLQTADPADYSIYTALEGFCTSLGDVKPKSTLAKTTATSKQVSVAASGTATAPLTTPKPTATGTITKASGTGTAANILTNPGCSFVNYALNFCESATPGFTDLSASQMATCLCYSGTKWNPTGFDSPASTCVDFLKTADPSGYSDIKPFATFCTAVGDVFHSGQTSTTASGSARAGFTNTPLPTSSKGVLSASAGTSTSIGATATIPSKTATVTQAAATTVKNDGARSISMLFDGAAKIMAFSLVAVLLGSLVLL